VLRTPGAKLHLYGKSEPLYGKKEARPGRKMGHFTVLGDDAGRRAHRDRLRPGRRRGQPGRGGQGLSLAKGRPADHPLIVHIPDAAALDRWAREVPDAARKLAAAFWPGPLTLILKRQPTVPDAVTGGQDTVGLRVPNHPVALALLREFAKDRQRRHRGALGQSLRPYQSDHGCACARGAG
jgi:hypothetical protein